MFTVTDLAAMLATFPPDTPLGMLTVTRVGRYLDITATPIVSVQAGIVDDGTVNIVWIIGTDHHDSSPGWGPPPLVSWPCRCGQLVHATLHDPWPSCNHRDTH